MCGIVGFITNEKLVGVHIRKKFLKQAIMVDTVRGPHSTGMFMVEHSYEPEKYSASGYYKDVVNGFEFVETDEYAAIMADTKDYRAVVAHNRFATMGAKSDVENAHPFHVENIVLVHNGTLHSTSSLPIPLHTLEGVSVDSHCIAHNLAEHTIDEIIPELWGAFTLVWHDYRDNGIHVIRNDDRPLHFTKIASQDTLVFASEAFMLKMLLERMTEKSGPVYYPKPGLLMSFYPGSLEPETRKVELGARTERTNANYTGWGGSFYNRSTEGWPKRSTNTQTKATTADKKQTYDFFSGSFAELGIVRNCIYRYVPVVVAPTVGMDGSLSKNYARVSGNIDVSPNGAYLAELSGIDLFRAEAASRRPWSVKATAVRNSMTETGDWSHTILCELVDYDWAQYERECGKVLNDTSNTCYVDDLEDATELTLDEIFGVPYLKGPYGQDITEDKWIDAVSEGCTNCGREIFAEEHDWVEWVGDGQMWPLCPDCVDSDMMIEEVKGSLKENDDGAKSGTAIQ